MEFRTLERGMSLLGEMSLEAAGDLAAGQDYLDQQSVSGVDLPFRPT
ncbi:MAG: hypothetical protein P8J33_14150 [Pirellulaceae bacterium]|nr:hypothetical protein [Pirellulaceae bacterium]